MLGVMIAVMLFQSFWLFSALHEYRLPCVLSAFLVTWANMGTASVMRCVWLLFLIILDEESLDA